MKIGLVAPAWNPIPPPRYGGSESMVDGLARTLHRAGHDVELFAPEGSTCPVPTHQIKNDSLSRRLNPVSREMAFTINAFEQLGSYDVVHDNSIVGALYARAYHDVPFVTTNHAPFVGDLQTLYNHVAPWCTIVAVSDSQARAAQVPVEVVHPGIDTERFQPGEGKGDYLLFVGSMQADSGPHLAAQAARAAGKRLLIASDTDNEFNQEFFEQHVEPLLCDDVEFVDDVSDELRISLIGNARALMNTVTWSEPFGFMLAESLSCGTPVVSLSSGAANEILEHGKTGVICHSELDLVDACASVDEINRETCRDSAVGRFSLDRMARDYVAIYEKAAKRKWQATTRTVINLTDLPATVTN